MSGPYTYYVGTGGNNANAGTSWALRKLTLNGAEDIPVAAGDTVYVGPGTYRETLTVDVSGSAGSPITYIGDYTGAATDGVGGVVRITGSDNDQTATRANGIKASSKNYRSFTGFVVDTTTSNPIIATSAQDWIIDKCAILSVMNGYAVNVDGSGQLRITIQNSIFWAGGVLFQHSASVDNAGHSIQNCIVIGGTYGAYFLRVGGGTVKNCVIVLGYGGASVRTATLTAGQTITVNNCILANNNTALLASALGEIIENYNTFYGSATLRTNVATGANSNAYPPLFDTRWFFEAVGGGDMLTPFDLASYSQLVNVAGTSPTTTDMRGTAVIGAQREWGALEYDPNLDIEAGSGGAVSISPYRGNIG